jgi:hypothetical protein
VWAHDNGLGSPTETHHPAVDDEALVGDPAHRFDEHGRSRLATDPIALPFPAEAAVTS